MRDFRMRKSANLIPLDTNSGCKVERRQILLWPVSLMASFDPTPNMAVMLKVYL